MTAASVLNLVDEMPNDSRQAHETTETTVGGFLQTLEGIETVSETVELDDLSVANSDTIKLASRDDFELVYDEESRDRIGKFLGVPSTYLKKCPDHLAQHNLNYWFSQKSGSGDVEYSVSPLDGKKRLVSFAPEGQTLIPIHEVAVSALKAFKDEDTVTDFSLEEDSLHLSVVSPSRFVEVEGDGSRLRPKVGDITQGGITITFNRNKGNKLVMEPFSFRLVCSNGMVMKDQELDRVSFRANTVEEILAQIEGKAEAIMSRMEDRYLQQIARSAEIPVTGDIYQLARHIGQEYGYSTRVVDFILEQIPLLPENVTTYDVVQLFTMAANHVGFNTRMRLQELGGNLMLDPSTVTDRCDTCEQLLH